MSDQVLRDHARRMARNRARGRAKRRLYQRLVREFEIQREVCRELCSEGAQEKTGIAVLGPTARRQKPHIVDPRSESNIMRGLCKRIATYRPFERQEIRKFKKFVAEKIKEYEPLDYVPMSHELLNEKWLESSKYNVKKRTEFHNLLQSYLDNNYSEKELYECKIFVKREITEEMKEPRIISSRSDMYKAIVAPYIRMIEERVYNEHFIKHCTPIQVSERVRRVTENYEYFYETDYSSFESSFSIPFLQACEKQLFEHMLRNNPEILRHVKVACNGDNRLSCIYGKANLPGSRMSGELWTSLANGFSNMMMIEYMVRNTNKESHRYDYLVEGDDGLIGTTQLIDLSPSRRLGFTLTLKQGRHINDLSFCGMIVGPNGLYADPRKVLLKFGNVIEPSLLHIRDSKRYDKIAKEYMRTKALSTLVTSGHTPIIGAVVNKILDLTEGSYFRLKYLDFWESDIMEVQKEFHKIKRANIDDADREFFAKTFGIPAHQQLLIEKDIETMNTMRFKVDFDLMEFMPFDSEAGQPDNE